MADNANKMEHFIEWCERLRDAPLGTISEEMFEEGLKVMASFQEEWEMVGKSYIYSRGDFELSMDRVDAAIKSGHAKLRVALIQRIDWVPTQKQENQLEHFPYDPMTEVGFSVQQVLLNERPRWNAMRERQQLEREGGIVAVARQRKTL